MNPLNTPIWNPLEAKKRGAFHESWFIKVNDPVNNRALWLRFALLVSRNGFRRIAENWGIFFQREKNREVQKTAFRQTHDISAFQYTDGGTIQIADTSLIDQAPPLLSRGSIRSKGHTLQWDLSMEPGEGQSLALFPTGLHRMHLLKNMNHSVFGNLRVSGSVTLDGHLSEWKDAPGMQGHIFGSQHHHSWIWGHCNSFVNEKGEAVPFTFEGISGKARWKGSFPTPRLSSFYFHYQGKAYLFNSLWSSLRAKSRSSLTDWDFQVEAGDLLFRGQAKAEHKDFAGLSFEDTNGSLLYSANSKLSDLKIQVYRRGKLETSLLANGTAAFEVVSGDRNPYVPLLI